LTLHLPSACRTATAAALVAVLGVGCHPTPPHAAVADDPASVADNPSSGTSAGRSPAAHAAADLHLDADAGRPNGAPSLGTPPAGDDRAAPSTVEADPQAAAARLVTDRLAAEGLETVWLDTQLLETTELKATVQVQVAHSPGRGHPTQTGYQLTLTRHGDGWRLERLSGTG
jgi:hypothetical protein